MRLGPPERNSLDKNQAEQFASVECLSDTVAEARSIRRLRHGVDIHLSNDGSIASTVAGLPSGLKHGSYYIPVKQCPVCSESDNRQYLITVSAPFRLYVLWPALQEPPAWLCNEFELVPGAEVKVRWSGFSMKQRLYLNVTNQRRMYQEQVLLVFRVTGDRGLVSPGEEIQLPYTALPEHAAGGQPYYSHVLCLCPATDSSLSGAGCLSPSPNKQTHKDPNSLCSCSLLEIYMALEEGSFDPIQLSITAADSLLKRSMAAVDDELLFMLVEAGIGTCSSLPCLQLLLQYAQYEDLPQLAQQVLQQTAVEMTQPVLDWLMKHMVEGKQFQEAEALLASYCMSRRNPLSSVAAIEHAVIKAAHSRLTVNDDAMQLAKKFKVVKMHLLQQLGKQVTAPAELSGVSQQLAQNDSPAITSMTQDTALGSSSRRHTRSRLKPLQQAIRDCMQKTTAYMLGRGGSDGPHSIHDSSPYSYAITLEDTDMLRVPAVAEYTRRVWYGLDIHKIAQAWDTAAATAAVAATSNRHSGTGWGLVSRKGNAHAKQRAVARKSLAVAAGHVPKPLTAVAELDQLAPPLLNPIRRKSLTLGTTDNPWAALSVLAAGTGQASLEVSTAASSMDLPGSPKRAHASAGSEGLLPIPESTAGSQGGITPVAPSAGSGAAPTNPAAFSALVQSSLLFQSTGTTGPPAAAAAVPPEILLSSLYQTAGSKSGAPKPPALGSPTAGRPLAASRFASHSSGPVAESVESSSIVSLSLPSHTTRVPGRRASMDVGGMMRRSTATSVIGADGSGGQVESVDADVGAEDAADALAWLSPDVGVELLQNMGLAGGVGQPLARAAMQLLHGLLLTPRALHSAARGRWMKRCWFELWFLVIYQGMCMGFIASKTALSFLPIMIIGNLVNVAFEVHWLHGNSFKQYIRDHWAKLDLLVNIGLLGAVIWECTVNVLGHQGLEDNELEKYGVHLEHVVPSALSVFVWARALGVITPANQRMGALLYTLRRAAEEAAVMIPLVLVLMLGFSTTLFVVYNSLYHSYSSLIGSLRMVTVILLGGHHLLLDFESEESHDNVFLETWGQVIIIVYAVIVNILIMTLLVAVITKTYNPESVKAQAVLMGAEAVRHYDWRVRHSLASSPINLIQLLLAWLPQGYRSRVSPSRCLRYWLPPLDGYVPDAVAGAAPLLLPTGPPEVCYLGYLLCLYPLGGLAAVTIMLLHLPFGVLHYMVRGHRMWLRSTWDGTANKNGAKQGNPAAETAAADISIWERRFSADVTSSRASTVRNSSVEYVRTDKSSFEVSHFASGDKQDMHKQVLRHLTSAVVAQANSRTPPVPQTCLGHAVTLFARALHSIHSHVVGPAASLVMAAVLGIILHTLLLVAVVLALVWAWVTRVVFSVYCIMVPWVGTCNCCMHPRRFADYWGKADVHDAFAEAKLKVASSDNDTDLVDKGFGYMTLPRSSDGTTICQVVAQPNRLQPVAKQTNTNADTAVRAEGDPSILSGELPTEMAFADAVHLPGSASPQETAVTGFGGMEVHTRAMLAEPGVTRSKALLQK